MSDEKYRLNTDKEGEFLTSMGQFSAIMNCRIPAFRDIIESCTEQQLQNIIRVLEDQMSNVDPLSSESTDALQNYAPKIRIAEAQLQEIQEKNQLNEWD